MTPDTRAAPSALGDDGEWTRSITMEKWGQFADIVKLVDSSVEKMKATRSNYVPAPLWRGQSNAAWALQTTLERFNPSIKSFADYYRAAYASRPQIEAFTGREWKLDTPDVYAKWSGDYDSMRGDLPAYEYFAYLRHYGFPSPLLDWSRSPYVAAWFALSEAGDHDAAVYVYFESAGIKTGSSNASQIHVRGPYVSTDKRHFLQQCQYTLCARFVEAYKGVFRWHYADHHEVFDRKEKDQDVLLKVTLKSGMKDEALRELDRYNLNAYSLFGSQEALMRTMARRELHKQLTHPQQHKRAK